MTPPNVFHVNSSQILLWPKGDKKDEAYLLGILSSIPLDWYCRRFVEVNFNFYLFNPLPIPRLKRTSVLWQQIVKISGQLASPDKRFLKWATEVGVDCSALTIDEKENKINELDALVAHSYGLNESQIIHIYETFHKGWSFEGRLKQVLLHFNSWKNRI